MDPTWPGSETFVTRLTRCVFCCYNEAMAQPTRISFADWTLHRAAGELERAGKRVRLQDLPGQILDELLLHAGEVVTREQLIARLWPRTVVDYEANLNSSVRRLRAALGDDANAPRFIETVPRSGRASWRG